MPPKGWVIEIGQDGNTYWRSPDGAILYRPDSGWWSGAESEADYIAPADFIALIETPVPGATPSSGGTSGPAQLTPNNKPTWTDPDTGIKYYIDMKVIPNPNFDYTKEVGPDNPVSITNSEVGSALPKYLQTGVSGGGNAGSPTAWANYGLAKDKFAYDQAQDAIKRDMDAARQQWQMATDARDFTAAQKWLEVGADLRQQQFDLDKEGQQFNQAINLRKQIVDEASHPQDWLSYAFNSAGQKPPEGIALKDQLAKTPIPGVGTNAPPVAPVVPGVPSVVANATTGMFPAGYEQQNPNVSSQLAEWQAQRTAAGQDPHDTVAFRQHLVGLGAPDFGGTWKPGEAPAPVAVKQPDMTGGATLKGGEPSVANPNTQPLNPTQLHTAGQIRTNEYTPPQIAAALIPAGTPTAYNGTGIAPYAMKPQGNLRPISLQTMRAMAPSVQQAYQGVQVNTGNGFGDQRPM